jgi:hypothetical protein
MMTSAQTSGRRFDGMPVRQDATARLLVLLAKTTITPAQLDAARRLANEVLDWHEFTQLAAAKFIATYAYRHLSRIPDALPASALEPLRKLAYGFALASLRTTAALVTFHRRCIAEGRVSYVYLKGPTLAAQYSQDPGARFCRDIDVLIAQRDFKLVLSRASASGYAVFIDFGQKARAMCKRDLDFLANCADVVTIVSEDGVIIELHRRLDKQSVDFDLVAAFATAEEVELSGLKIRTLAKPLHFTYVCYHHSRHFWSKLHWLADLDTMAQAPHFDADAVRELADRIGIRPTIEGALQLAQIISSPSLCDCEIDQHCLGGQFLLACLFNLDGDLELEQSLRKGMPFGDFASSWQIDMKHYDRFAWNSWRSRLRPTTTQFLRLRLPRPLHWLYTLRNAAALLRVGLQQAVGRASRSADGISGAGNRSADK